VFSSVLEHLPVSSLTRWSFDNKKNDHDGAKFGTFRLVVFIGAFEITNTNSRMLNTPSRSSD
jgi:hypothetical protein